MSRNDHMGCTGLTRPANTAGSRGRQAEACTGMAVSGASPDIPPAARREATGWVAFYAPMKPPDHPTPSGDRRIAQLTLRALDEAGLAPRLVSRLRVLDMAGDPARQAELANAADHEARRLIAALAPDPPRAWLTYHCHYKAPDLVGPAVAEALGLPYIITEPSLSPRRRQGPWARFAAAAESAITRADRLFWTTRRDRPALDAAGHAPRMAHLPAFVDAGPAAPPPRPARRPLHLLSVAMMRPGDKAESYRRLAAGLARLALPWRLTAVGDGPARVACLSPLAALGPVTHRPDLATSEAIRPLYEAADLMVWPGAGEGVGMVWLEAQAAGLPVVAEDQPAARDLVGAGELAAPNDPDALAAAIARAATARRSLSARARAHVLERHSLAAAAHTLRDGILEQTR